jgi:two-component system, OmpR family, response regulator QseB
VRILIVEDDPLLCRGIAEALRRWTYVPECTATVAAAEEALQGKPFDAVLLDLKLPDGHGLDVLRAMRSAGDTTPVIVITARDAVSDRVAGLDAGADDYLIKPFHLDELAARLRSIHRRSRGLSNNIVVEGRLTLDTIGGDASFDGRRVSLSKREFLLLRALTERAGRVVPRGTLERALFGNDGVDSNALEVHVHALRRKLARDSIRTVRGLGYMFVGETPP